MINNFNCSGVCSNDCNFDANLSTCNWENTDGDDFDWSLSRKTRLMEMKIFINQQNNELPYDLFEIINNTFVQSNLLSSNESFSVPRGSLKSSTGPIRDQDWNSDCCDHWFGVSISCRQTRKRTKYNRYRQQNVVCVANAEEIQVMI